MAELVTDFCVAWSAIDCAAQAFAVEARLASCRAIDFNGSLTTALEEMRAAGVTLA